MSAVSNGTTADVSAEQGPKKGFIRRHKWLTFWATWEVLLFGLALLIALTVGASVHVATNAVHAHGAATVAAAGGFGILQFIMTEIFGNFMLFVVTCMIGAVYYILIKPAADKAAAVADDASTARADDPA